MNSVLQEILTTRQVTDGTETFRLRSEVGARQGALLARVVERVRPRTSLEVGFAYGVATLYICEALARIQVPGAQVRHVAIDPFQSTQWRGIGVRNVREAGFAPFVELREQASEIALPELLNEGTLLDMALIDGWHTFDHALVDFFYVNKMLRIGGVVILDDASYPSIEKLVDHILTYGSYCIFDLPKSPVPHVSARALLPVRRMAKFMGLQRTKWPRAVALQKTARDTRGHDWFKSF